MINIKENKLCQENENEKEIVARLKYLNYDVYFTYISPTSKNPSEIRIKLHD